MTSTTPSQPLGSVLVTGGCGFLGSHIVRLLLERYTTPTTRIEVLDLRTANNRQHGATYHEGDLTNAAALRTILASVRPDVIIHTASPVFRAGGGKASRDLAYAVNVKGTATLLAESRAAGVKAFVYTSSASVINDTRTDLINADERWGLVRAPLQKDYYSDTKAEAEALVLAASTRTPAQSPFLTAALRPSAIFGEGDVQMLPNTLAVLRDGRTGFQLGANENLFDYTYVGNVAHAHILAAQRLLATAASLSSDGAPSDDDATKVDAEAFLITNTTPIYFWDFHRALWHAYLRVAAAVPGFAVPPPVSPNPTCIPAEVALALASVIEWVYFLLRLGPPRLTRPQANFACMTRYFRTSKAQTRLGYQPVWTLQEGIQRSVEWFVQREVDGGAGKKEK